MSHKQHQLYFVSDDEIESGDWYIDDAGQVRKNIIAPGPEYDLYWTYRKAYKKIAAATDPALGLLTIPQKWVRDEYVRTNGNFERVHLLLMPVGNNNNPSGEWMKTKDVLKPTINNEVIIVL